MKRKLLFSLVALLMTCVTAWAETVTWSSSDISGLYLTYGSTTINGIKVAVSGASISSSHFYLIDEEEEYYPMPGTITFSVAGGTISSIVINGSSFSASGLSSGWTSTSTTVSWSGTPTSSVELEADSWSNYATISSIVFEADFPNSGTTGECTWTFSNARKTLTISPTNGVSGAMSNEYYSSNPAPWGTEITKVVIEEGVTNVGDYAFSECAALTDVTLPSTVTSIGSNAFEDCRALPSITFPKGLTSIGSFSFMRCSALTSISIPGSVETVGWDSFLLCSSLSSVTLESGVETIDGYAFGSTAVTSINIPASVTSINSYAFNSCSKLANVYLYQSDLSTLTVGSSAFTSSPTYHGLVGATGTTQTTALTVTKDIATSAALTANQDPSHTSDYYTTYYNGLTDVTVPADVKIYTGEVSGSNLNLTEINSGTHLIPAATAVVLKGTGTSISATLAGTATALVGTNNLHGVDVRTAIPTDGTVYVLGSDGSTVGFYKYTASHLGANKAYLKLNGSGAALARAIRFSFDESTGIEAVSKTEPSESDAIYTLQGIRIAPSAMQKGGVYIVNGKKVIK